MPCEGVRSFLIDQTLQSTEITAETVIFNQSYTCSTDNCYAYAIYIVHTEDTSDMYQLNLIMCYS